MLTTEQLDEFNENGFLIIRNAISKEAAFAFERAIDYLHDKDEPVSSRTKARWDMRNCLFRHPYFINLLLDHRMLSIPAEILGWNIKLLTTHIVKIAPQAQTNEMSILFHQDGGALSFELSEPLPLLIIKMNYCISGDKEPDSGQLRVVPGSNRLIGPPVMKTDTEPFGAIDLITEPGDLTLLDWRCWHALSPNKSKVVRRNIYYGFGPRWLMPMDYDTYEQLGYANTAILTQLLGGRATPLGDYLPTDEDTPLKALFESQKG